MRIASKDHEEEFAFTPNLDLLLATSLRKALASVPIGKSLEEATDFRDMLSVLERYIPFVLRGVHPEWDDESLDGLYPHRAIKSGIFEAEIAGMGLLISDQTLTPFQLQLEIAPDQDEVVWLDCRLGEISPHGLIRTPYHLGNTHFAGQWDRIEWAYHVCFGVHKAES